MSVDLHPHALDVSELPGALEIVQSYDTIAVETGHLVLCIQALSCRPLQVHFGRTDSTETKTAGGTSSSLLA